MLTPMEGDKMESTKKATVLRMDYDLYARLQEQAKNDNRSVNQQIVYYISKALAAEKPAS